MPKYFPRQLLFRLRNEIPLERVIAEHLNWPSKRREGRFLFVCPRCGESQTAVNPQTNLGRCFRCEANFNSIDFVMLVTGRDFVETVHFLETLLPERTSRRPPRLSIDRPSSRRTRKSALVPASQRIMHRVSQKIWALAYILFAYPFLTYECRFSALQSSAFRF